jgi:hypothetical protein
VAVADTNKGGTGRPRVNISEAQVLAALSEVRSGLMKPRRIARLWGVSEPTVISRFRDAGYRVFYSADVSGWVVETISEPTNGSTAGGQR